MYKLGANTRPGSITKNEFCQGMVSLKWDERDKMVDDKNS